MSQIDSNVKYELVTTLQDMVDSLNDMDIVYPNDVNDTLACVRFAGIANCTNCIYANNDYIDFQSGTRLPFLVCSKLLIRVESNFLCSHWRCANE